MTLRAVEVAAVSDEISRSLTGRPVQKVVQPDASTIVLWFPKAWLLLCADAQLGRLHLLASKPAGTGEAAPAFCMLLRKELEGARLVLLTPVPGERACELLFQRGDQQRRLRLFLFGRSAQLTIVGDEERVLGAIGPALRPHTALPPPRPLAGESRFLPPPSLSSQIETHYTVAANETVDDRAREAAEKLTRAALERARRKQAALEKDRARAEASVEKRKLGDLLLAHLHEIPRGAASVTLADDFEDGAPLTIALDPARSARDNAARFYKEHKRLSRALTNIDARLAETRALIAKLESGAPVRGSAKSQELAEKSGGKAKAKNAKPEPYKEFRASNGDLIWVGKGAEKNDQLTFKVARGSDLWLHARDAAGAHVIVPLNPGRAVDEQTLLDAATLAAHHSSVRDDPQVDVGYTLRKYVRKPPKSRAGSVITSELKTLRVRMEPARLSRLLASRTD